MAGFNYRYLEDPATPGPDINTGKFSLTGEWLVDSPLQGVGLLFQGEVSLYNLALASLFTQISGTYRQYPFSDLAYFVFGGVEGLLDSRFPRPGVELRAGVGYGRFTDVTPLVRALRIEEKLLQRGVLLAALRETTLFRLAQEIGRTQIYSSLSDLAAALAKIISTEIQRALDPHSIFLIEEVLQEPGLERYCGWTVQFGLGYALSRPQAGSLLSFNLALQGAVIPDPHSQILFKIDLAAPYQVFEEYTLNLSALYSYQLNETTTFSAQYLLRQVKPRGQAPAGTQNAAFQLGFKVGGVNVTIQVGFSKLAEAPGWTQDFLISAGWQIW